MNTKVQFKVSSIFLIFALCLSLVNVNTAFADDTPPTEPPPATEVATEPATSEASPTTEPVVSTPTPVETESTEEETTLDEFLSEIPDNTDVVILDENGNPVPLVSQDAVEIMQEEDPLWCPVGAPLNSPLCRNFTGGSAITNMLTDMRNNTGTYDENGVIYFTSSAGGSLALTNAAASLLTDFALLSNFNLTLTGGWNGNLSSPSFSGQTNFGSNSLTIGTAGNPWIGSITLNNFIFNDVDNTPGVQVYTTNGSVTLNNVDADDTDDTTPINIVVTGIGSVSLTGVDVSDGTDGNGITITTNSGNISLADVDVTNQDDGYTANLQSQSGNITITNGTSNGSSFNGGDNSLGFVATTNTGTISITGASGSGNQITFNDADGSSNGATLSGSTVTLTQVTANNNNMNGIQISNAGVVTVNNVIATNNGTDVSGAPDLGSGLRVFGTGSTVVNVNGGTYSNNERYGIEISNGSVNVISNPSMTGNDEGNLIVVDNTAPTISPSFNCSVPGSAGWCRGTITINWNVGDAQSAVTTSGCQTSFNTNTSAAGSTVSCSATSTGGTTNSSVLLWRDAVAPNTTGTRSPGSTGSGWNNTDVTVTFSGTDANSGIAFCTSPVTITTEGPNQPAAGSCTDVAGNTDTESVNVSIDKTAPLVTASLIPNPNGNGWNSSGVLVIFQGSDPGGSGVPFLGCSPFLGGSNSEGANQSSSSTCTDRAGNSASLTVFFNIDLTNPVATATKSPAPNANGWNNTDVVVTFNGTDNVSGIASCTPPATVSTEGTNQSRSGNCTDEAGRISNTATASNINIDKTPPTITFVSRTPANANGWNNSSVTVNWSCSDSRSGVVSGSVSQTVSSEGANQSATGTCTDLAGNSSSSTQSGINIDLTNPTLNLPSNITEEATGPAGAIVNYSASASDNLDTTPTFGCAPASGGTYALGTTNVNCSATDDAGNSAAGSFMITVVDTTAPVIAAHADITEEALSAAGNVVAYTSPTTSDAVDGPGTASCAPASGSTFAIGDTTVTCNATDAHGNVANATTFEVHIIDTTAPAIFPHADITEEATSGAGNVVTYTSPSTFDVVDGTGTASCLPASGSTFAVGDTTVTCNAADSRGNVSTPTTFVVHIVDTTPPTISAHADIFSSTTNDAGIVVTYFAPSTFDIVDGAGVATCTPASGSKFPDGETVVTCNATDAHGNAATSVRFSVFVDYTPIQPTSGVFIPATGGTSVKLDCTPPDLFKISMAGARIIFNNLCDYDAFINGIVQVELPGELPSGSDFVDGYSINISKDGKLVSSLPKDASVVIEFNVPNNLKGADFGVLYWNGTKWAEIAGELTDSSHFLANITAEMADSNTFIFVAK